MDPIPRKFRLTTKSESGLQCDAGGLFLGDAPLLERDRGEAASWRPRSTDELNRDLTKRYGLPVDFTSRQGGLTAIGRALDRGDMAHAQMLALQLELPELPDQTAAPDPAKLAKVAITLRESGPLTKGEWDESKHPRWPAGSPDSTGGEFAPAGEASPASARSGHAAGEASATQSTVSSKRTLSAQTILDTNGDYIARFLVTPASKLGGVIVQKVTSVDRLYGVQEGPPLIGWEAWEIKPGEMATGNNVDDTWRAPPPDSGHPSVAIERTVTTEAWFYEGLTMQDLVENYGFTRNGSGFSNEANSTNQNPHLPTDNATPPLVRQRTFTKW